MCGGRTATAKVKLKKMRSHYVPQFVLREFTDKHGMLWMYEKSRDEIVRFGTKDALVINGYYHDDLERIFAQIEGEQSSCLKAVLGFCRTGTRSMSDDQMLTCCRKLVLMQLLRTPYAQATGVQALDGIRGAACTWRRRFLATATCNARHWRLSKGRGCGVCRGQSGGRTMLLSAPIAPVGYSWRLQPHPSGQSHEPRPRHPRRHHRRRHRR